MSSIYKRQFFIMAGMILVSFLLLGSAFIGLSYRYTISERQETLQHNAQYIADTAGSILGNGVTEGGYSIKAALFQPTVQAVSGVTDATVLLCVADGEVIFAADQEGIAATQMVGKMLPQGVVQAVQADGQLNTMSRLGDVFESQQYIAAAPIVVEGRGSRVLAGMVVVATETELLTEMWRAFATIFFFTAIVVILLAFVVSSVTSMRMTRPLLHMADAVRRFGHGEYDTRVNCGDRQDEMAELAEAFNTMADSITKAEARRSEFVANVSHELKTPMTTIAGFADGILDGTIPPERTRGYLETISSETRRLSRLVRRMLDLSRLQSAEQVTAQEQFDVSEILIRVLVSLERKINDRGLDVETELPTEPVPVWGDPDAITQVCYNLLDNAIKFATEGSTLGVGITIRGGKAYVAIKNEGETIDPQELPLLFDRFHKTDRSRSADREGVGLGLYIVKAILNNHHENIACTSQEGVTEFTFTLTQV